MARVETIIVGGGIGAGTPFTLDTFLRVSNISPPLAASGNIRQDTSSPPKVYIGEAAALQLSTIAGGAVGNANVRESVLIGEGATYQPAALITAAQTSVVIGRAAAQSNGGNSGVVIGDGATLATASIGSNTVLIGQGATIVNPAGGSEIVAIGSGLTISLGSRLVVIGRSASYAGNNNAVVIGYNSSVAGGAGVASCVLVGPVITNNQTRNILIGAAITITGGSDMIVMGQSFSGSGVTAAVQFYNDNPFTALIMGNGPTNAVPVAGTFRLTNATGSNVAAGDLTVQAGLGTGNAANAAVNLNSGVVGASGATLQTSRTGLQVKASTTAADTDVLVFDVTAAALRRVSIGANDSGGVGFRVLRIPN